MFYLFLSIIQEVSLSFLQDCTDKKDRKLRGTHFLITLSMKTFITNENEFMLSHYKLFDICTIGHTEH